MCRLILLVFFEVYHLIIRFLNAIKNELTGGSSDGGLLSQVVNVLSSTVITACVIIWLALCVISTVRYFGYRLVITNSRVVGKARGQMMDLPLTEVMNVYTEESLWGKLFGYGHVTVRTKKQALTFKNISNPKDFYRKLMDYASEYFAS